MGGRLACISGGGPPVTINPTMTPAEIADFPIPDFQRSLLTWFNTHARDLPWRRTGEAYPVWVSEIMLQQTRVAAVLEHYARFMARFPSIVALALAQEEEVLAAWSGLGYYRRAKLLHKAAQFIVREHQGSLPRTAEELRTLPGIGEYTAAAVASIAFGEAVAVVDGNVERVILRIFLPRDEQRAKGRSLPGGAANRGSAQWVRERAAELLLHSRAGDFNQSMMELGATVCLPRNPLCLTCPVEMFCSARGEHAAAPPKQMRSREIAYALLSRSKAGSMEVFLEQRPREASQMPGMWELPEIAIEESDRDRAELTLRHSITVTNYYVRVLKFPEREGKRRLAETEARRRWVVSSELGILPLTGLARKVLQRLKVMPTAALVS
jgi:A/G-specific adenine glycosylase